MGRLSGSTGPYQVGNISSSMTPHSTCGAILVVEDPFVSGFLRVILERQGYQVIPADLPESVEMVRLATPKIGLVITNLPSTFLEFSDRLPLLYLAAFPDPAATSQFRSSLMLRKPFHPDRLLECVGQLLLPM